MFVFHFAMEKIVYLGCKFEKNCLTSIEFTHASPLLQMTGPLAQAECNPDVSITLRPLVEAMELETRESSPLQGCTHTSLVWLLNLCILILQSYARYYDIISMLTVTFI